LLYDVKIIGGGLHDIPGTASSCGLASVPEESVSIFVVLRGVKNFRVASSLGAMFKAAEVAAGSAFFEVWAVFSVLCRFHRRTSWKPSSWVDGDPTAFCAVFWPTWLLALSTAFNSCSANV
jgi:hypothetical protein